MRRRSARGLALRLLSSTFAFCCTLAGGAAPAPADSVDVALSTHYSTGDYDGTDDVDVVYVPLQLDAELGLWQVRAVVPWLRVHGGSTTIETPGGPITTKNGTAAGLGDVQVEGARWFEPFAAWAPWSRAALRVKVPTGRDSEGLGTGEFDVTPELELAESYGRWTPFLIAGFRVLGDAPGNSYRDGFVATAGTLYRIRDWIDAGVFLDWKQAAVADSDDSLELLPMLRVAAGERWLVDGYVSTGFTDAVPDVGGGVELRYRFGDTYGSGDANEIPTELH